ncbi:peptidase M14, carboxypeptidase A, partial [Basidiobolus meristosporus CBS 931.73]
LHVRASPKDLESLAEFSPEVLIENIQESIDLETKSLKQAALAKRAVDDATWFQSYHTFTDIVQWLQNLSQKYPDLVTLVPSIGKTTLGKDIPALRITSKNGATKKKFWFQGLQHAREWIATTTMQYVADGLASGYATDASTKKLLDEAEIIIIPVSNPDGYEYTWNGDRLWRKNRRNNGGGVYGVDTNRNWPDHWNKGGSSTNPRDETYMGPSAGSEPEVKALINYYFQQTGIVGAIDYHSYSELIMWPYGWTYTDPATVAPYTTLAKNMKSAIRGVNPNEQYVAQQISDLYIASGSAADWFYSDEVLQKQKFRSTSLTVELSPKQNNPGFVLPPQNIIPVGKQTLASLK